jgi:hypothetical protein
MNQAKKLIFYVLLNIIVSAATIVGVLYLWENTRLKNALMDSAEPSLQETQPGDSVELETTTEPRQIEIAEAGGVGNLATEYIRLVRPVDAEGETISLQNWQLKDGEDQQFSILAQSGLASLELHTQGAVNIYSKAGQSNPIELYLGLENPLWSPGETVTLIDPQGEVHDTYLIP